MQLTRVLGWSSLAALAAAMVPALYFPQAFAGLLTDALPGGSHTAVAGLLGLLLLSYHSDSE